MRSIIFLGPDRVGKTSLIDVTAGFLQQSAGVQVQVEHFSGIKPHHHSPVEQFREKLEKIQSPGPHYLFLDRFVSDTLFYEEIRRQMPYIDPACSQEIESLLIEMSSSIDVVILNQVWNQELIDRHVAELKQIDHRASTYWINAQLELRLNEHKEYYKHTDEFFKNHSLISGNVHYVNPNPGDNLFTLCHAIPAPDC